MNKVPIRSGELKQTVPSNTEFIQIKTVIDEIMPRKCGIPLYRWHTEVSFYDENCNELWMED